MSFLDPKCRGCGNTFHTENPYDNWCSKQCEVEKVKMVHNEFNINLKSQYTYSNIFKILIINQDGIRYPQRQPPIWMQINLASGKCWCGKSKEKFDRWQRKYCTSKHSAWWYYHINAWWNLFRYEIIKSDNYTCTECGFKPPKEAKYSKDEYFDVDHIKAISLGGACYDVSNVRTLCEKCHKKKTKEDMRKLSYHRKAEGYEPFEAVI